MDYSTETRFRRLLACLPRGVGLAAGLFALLCPLAAGAAPKHVTPKHVTVEEKRTSEKKASTSKAGHDGAESSRGKKSGETRTRDADKKRDDEKASSKHEPDAKPSSDRKSRAKEGKGKPNKSDGDRAARSQNKLSMPVSAKLARLPLAPASSLRHPYQLPLDLLHARAPIVEGPPLIQQGAQRIDYTRLDARFAQLVRTPGMVGMAVAIVDHGKLNFVKGYGVTESGGDDPVTVHTVFRWASLSKTVAATMIGKLVEQGRLSLDDPIDGFDTTLRLPLDREKTATVEQLLSQRLGLPRNAYDDLLEHGEDPKLIRRSLARLKPVCAPGACFSYQNVAFDTVSEIVLHVTHRNYAEAVEDGLFAPLGMRNASIGRPGLVDAKSWAQPHVGKTPVRVEDPYYRIPAAGGVNSSILDLGLWLRAQMGETPTIISRRVLDTIHAPRISTAGSGHLTEYDRQMRDTSYALGWRNAYYAGHRLVGHRGAVRGYRSLILFDPDSETGVAVLWNSQGVRPVGIPLELFDMLYGLPQKDWLKLQGKNGEPLVPADDLSQDDRTG